VRLHATSINPIPGYRVKRSAFGLDPARRRSIGGWLRAPRLVVGVLLLADVAFGPGHAAFTPPPRCSG